jgi:hypothetical protein
VFVAYVIVAAATAGANAWAAYADFSRASFVVENSTEVGVPESWLPVLGALKLLGAIGLAVGVAGVSSVGVAAALGLVLFFVGAVATHVRAGVFHNLYFPGAFLGLATASLVLSGLR